MDAQQYYAIGVCKSWSDELELGHLHDICMYRTALQNREPGPHSERHRLHALMETNVTRVTMDTHVTRVTMDTHVTRATITN